MTYSSSTLRALALAAVSGSALTLIAQDAPPAPKNWETSAGLNLGLAGGNSDSFNVGGNLLTVKEWGQTGANQITVGADVNYGENTTVSVSNGQLVETDTTSVNNYGGFAQYNRLLTDRLYFGGRGDGRVDDIAGIDYRLTANVLLGYYLLKSEKLTLSVEAGPGYVWEDLDGVGTDDYATLRFGEKFEWKFNAKSRLFQSFEYVPQIDEWSNYNLVASVGVETALTEKMSLQVVFKDYYRSDPAPYSGTSPVVYREKNDYQLTAGIIYKFN